MNDCALKKIPTFYLLIYCLTVISVIIPIYYSTITTTFEGSKFFSKVYITALQRKAERKKHSTSQKPRLEVKDVFEACALSFIFLTNLLSTNLPARKATP